MTDEDRQAEKRFQELAARAAGRCCWVYSEFLNLAQQDVLRGARLAAPYTLWGGYAGAERVLAVFGSEADCGYPAQPPCTWLRIAPAAPKFADVLTHRDFLGALMNLGVRREMLGDIVLHENCGYLCCMDTVAALICRELNKVRHTTVRAAPVDALPEILTAPPEVQEFVAASERADAVVAAVYSLSRSESQSLFAAGRVFVCSRQKTNGSDPLVCGDMVSVRGIGRFLYEGPAAQTRRGRLRIRARVY